MAAEMENMESIAEEVTMAAEPEVVAAPTAKQSFKAAKAEEKRILTARMVEEAKSKSKVLNTFRIEKQGDDVIIVERFVLDKKYAGQPNVKEFTQPNGRAVYYMEKAVKNYSDNVVTE